METQNNPNNVHQVKPGRMQDSYNVIPYNFSIRAIFNDAWLKTKGYKATAIGAGLLYILSYIVLAIALSLISYIITSPLSEDSVIRNLLINITAIAQAIIILPVAIGLKMLGIKRAAIKSVRATMIFDYYNRIWSFVGIWFLMTIMVTIPIFIGLIFLTIGTKIENTLIATVFAATSILFFLSTIYLMLSYIFATALSADKKFDVWQSLEVSRRAITQHWFKVFFTLILTGIIIVIAALPLFIGLIWAWPWCQIVLGDLYRVMFGDS